MTGGIPAAAGALTIQVLLDDGTGTYPTDVSSYVNLPAGITVSGYGRAAEFDEATASTLGLTLDNSDGTFTAGTGFDMVGFDTDAFDGGVSLYVGQGIRYVEAIGSTTRNEFTGRITGGSLTWPTGGDQDAEVTISASDRLADAAGVTLRSMLEQEFLLADPSALYTLGEAQGAESAGDTSGNQASPLVIAGTGAAPVFGATTGLPDGSTGVSFSGGQFLRAPGTFVGTGAFTIECTYQRTNATAPTGLGPDESIVWVGGETFTPHYNVGLADDGSGFVHFQFFSNIVTPSNRYGTVNVCDGDEHDIAVTYDGATTLQVYIDGLPVGGAVGGTVTAPTVPCTKLHVGGGDAPLTNGVVSNVVVTNGVALSPATLLSHAQVALGATETTAARFARLASYGGFTTSTVGMSGQTVGAQATSGVSLMEALQAVEQAEGGFMYANGSGTLVLQGRGYRTQKTTADLTLTSDDLNPDVSATLDNAEQVTLVTITRTNGATQTVGTHTNGVEDKAVDTIVDTDAAALAAAQWIVAKHATPGARMGQANLGGDSLLNSPNAEAVLQRDLGDRLAFTPMPSQAWSGLSDVTIEGWSRTVDHQSWTVTANLLPWSLNQAAVWDDAGSTWDNAVWAN